MAWWWIPELSHFPSTNEMFSRFMYPALWLTVCTLLFLKTWLYSLLPNSCFNFVNPKDFFFCKAKSWGRIMWSKLFVWSQERLLQRFLTKFWCDFMESWGLSTERSWLFIYFLKRINFDKIAWYWNGVGDRSVLWKPAFLKCTKLTCFIFQRAGQLLRGNHGYRLLR